MNANALISFLLQVSIFPSTLKMFIKLLIKNNICDGSNIILNSVSFCKNQMMSDLLLDEDMQRS